MDRSNKRRDAYQSGLCEGPSSKTSAHTNLKSKQKHPKSKHFPCSRPEHKKRESEIRRIDCTEGAFIKKHDRSRRAQTANAENYLHNQQLDCATDTPESSNGTNGEPCASTLQNAVNKGHGSRAQPTSYPAAGLVVSAPHLTSTSQAMRNRCRRHCSLSGQVQSQYSLAT